MHKVNNKDITNVFKNSFKKTRNKYNTKTSKTTFYKPFVKTKLAQYAISYRGPHLWNSLVPISLQNISFNTFKIKIKEFCIKLKNENNYF